MNKNELFKPGPSPIFGREEKPLRPEEYPSQEEIDSLTGEVGASRVETALRIGMMTSALAPIALTVACEQVPETPAIVRTPEEAGVTPSPTLEIKTPIPTPTETATPTAEMEPTPTEEAVQSITEITITGFGMEELTSDQQEYLNSLEANFIGKIIEKVEQGDWKLEEIKEFAINKTGGHKEEELVLGGYLVVTPQEGEETFWSYSEELGNLIQAPKYQEIFPTWNPNELRFEAKNAKGEMIAYWNPEKSIWEQVAPPAPTAEPTKEPTPTEEPKEPVEMVATGNVDLYLSPDGQKVGYFVPGQRFTPTGAEQDGWIQVVDSDGNVLWIQEGGPYGPAGEVEIPPAVCEVPHFPDRTPDRKTGYNTFVGERIQWIRPEGNPISPHYRWFRRTHDSQWVTMREGKIIAVDREKQIVTFDLGGDLIIKRKVAENTQFMMFAHEVYQGMPQEQAIQIGGNLCDLEEEDAVAVLHPSEGEGVNPNPNLVDLWGVLIVQ